LPGWFASLPASHAVAQTTTATISWAPGGHIRVYTCDAANVTEKGWDGEGPWHVGSFKAQGRAVSATSWVDNGVHICVYVTDDGSHVVEHAWDGAGPWYIGAYK